MARYEMVMEAIEKMENENTVVGAVRLVDGTELVMDEVLVEEETFEMVVALGTVSVEEYEENGFELDGLEMVWVAL